MRPVLRRDPLPKVICLELRACSLRCSGSFSALAMKLFALRYPEDCLRSLYG
jgi:hypothetical protein